MYKFLKDDNKFEQIATILYEEVKNEGYFDDVFDDSIHPTVFLPLLLNGTPKIHKIKDKFGTLALRSIMPSVNS